MKRSRAGFTIAELLAVIGIISILASVAFFAVHNYMASLRLRRLDSAAEELFLFFQSRMSEAAAFAPESLKPLKDVDYFTVGAGETDERLDAFSPDEILSLLEIRSAVIEFDLSSHDILFVAVSDELSPEELVKVYFEDKSVSRLHEKNIGYYGFGDVTLKERDSMLIPKIEVKNGDELTIEITCENVKSDAVVELVLQTVNGSVSEILYPEISSENTLRASYILDKTVENCGSLYMNTLAPTLGTGIVTAAARIRSGDDITSKTAASRNSVRFNPLFGGSDEDCAEISCLRHFNNLRFKSEEDIEFLQTCDIAVGDFEQIPEFCGRYNGCGHLLTDISLKSGGLFSELNGSIENLHIVRCKVYGSGVFGAVCDLISEDGSLENCSVSETEIICADGGNCTVGGLAGHSCGTVIRCSSSANFDINSSYALIGGLVGMLDGKAVSCRSSGTAVLNGADENSSIGGIAAKGKGTAENCFSEMSAGYISGAVFHGIGDVAFSDCSFLTENAWLTAEVGITAAEYENLDISGFEKQPGQRFPEPVKVGGLPRRFGDFKLLEPRGLIGVVKVKYDGEFSSKILASFDAYGNETALRPDIFWDNPTEGEERYYFFKSEYSAPESGIFCELSEPSSLGTAFKSGKYICSEILGFYDGNTALLRFCDYEKRIVSDTSEPVESLEDGKIGLLTIIHDPISTLFDFDIDQYCYHYFELDSDQRHTYSFNGSFESEIELPRIDDNDYVVAVYAFCSQNVADRFNISSDFEPHQVVETDVGELRFYEIFRGENLNGQYSADLSLSGSPEVFNFKVDIEKFGFLYSVTMYSEKP